ncbi:MAG: Vitamin B12 dependent methionine synthase activation subunit [Clostridia bacterium]|nr:Vitamin B12 dependent methionine synthase activation subunit [Clostridia bacterium]
MTVKTKDFAEVLKDIPVDIDEASRYCGAKNDQNTKNIISSCLDEAKSALSYKVCYAVFDIHIENDTVIFPFCELKSKDLSKNLAGLDTCVIFAATVGLEIDRLIKKYAAVSPAKSVVLGAIGAERIEKLCDVFADAIKSDFGETRPRFSPGYGDLPLSFQREIFKVLQMNKNIGISLGENLLMTPSKSVTAIIGVKK